MRPLYRPYRRTTLIGGAALALLGGLFIGRQQYTLPGWLFLGLLAALAVAYWRHWRSIEFVLIVLLAIILGHGQGARYAARLDVYESHYFVSTTVTVRALGDAVYGKGSQLTFDAGNVVAADGTHLPGKIAVSGFGENAVFAGDIIEVTGKLRPAKGSYQARLSYARLDTVGHNQTLISEFRRYFGAGISSALPEPAAPFALGLLIGQRATLPESVKEDLLMVGLTHIIAVSGYNLTIMLRASKNLFAARSKRLSVAFSVFLIGTFLLIAGNSASIVRASIVSMISIIAGYYGRVIKPLNIILLVAAGTAWVKPSYVWGDISWYLSFLAFYGVIVLSPMVQSRLTERFRERMLIQVAIDSICAEIVTLPIVLYMFGQMSRVALLGNLVIATMVPFAMLASLIAGLAGMLVQPLAGWLSWPATIILTYMLDTAHVLASLPNVFIEGIGLDLLQMLSLYMLIIAMSGLLWFKSRTKSVIVTDIT